MPLASTTGPRNTPSAADADPRSLLAEPLSAVRVERIYATDPSFEDAFIWFIRQSHHPRRPQARPAPA